tara:strand:+ start:2612 stop:2890 length:279 start_codon:yes stop_codon:yes gene_type:complete
MKQCFIIKIYIVNLSTNSTKNSPKLYINIRRNNNIYAGGIMANKIKWFLFWVVILMIALSVIIEMTPTKEDDKYLPFVNLIKTEALEFWGKM